MNDLYKESIELAVRLLDQGQIADAKEVLESALRTPAQATGLAEEAASE